MTVFGPGVLKIGETATAVDASCLVNGLKIEATADFGDPTWKLCGTQKAGSRKFTWEMTGNLDIDPEDPDGLFMLTQTAYGTDVPFVFTPNNTAAVTATGVVTLVPMTFGADEYGEDLTSDIAWPLVGEPLYSPTAPVVEDVGVEAAEIGDAVPAPRRRKTMADTSP